MIPPIATGRGSVASRRHWSRALSWSWSWCWSWSALAWSSARSRLSLTPISRATHKNNGENT